MATSPNNQVKNELIYILSSQGYKPYAQLLSKFYVHVTDNPKTVAAMIPDEHIILINPERLGRSKKAASTAIRHEILHQYLDHALRISRHLGKLIYTKDFLNDPLAVKARKNANIAGDYDISRAYTDTDIEQIRKLHGLLLCDEHPEWLGKSFEEIYDLLDAEQDNQQPDQDQSQGGGDDNQRDDNASDSDDPTSSGSTDGQSQPSQTSQSYSAQYVQGWNDFVAAVERGDFTADELRRI